MEKIYEIENLKVLFHVNGNFLRAIEGIDLVINKGESVAIVGESGCGKSVTCQAMLGLLPFSAFMSADKLNFYTTNNNVINMAKLSQKEYLKIRGKEISFIFQDPNTALNPVLTIGEQLDEMFIYHLNLNKKEAKKRSIKLLKEIGIPEAEKRYYAYPHEFSGGQKQRIVIAIAFSLNPKLILADEPTTALDVTVQKQILDLLTELKTKHQTSVLLITHDLGLVRKYSDRLYVMYCGKIVETGNTLEVLNNPMHPYTQGLLDSIPTLDEEITEFKQIKNNVPSPLAKPKGCYFCNRCPYAKELCFSYQAPLKKIENRMVRCWKAFNMENEGINYE